MESVKRVDFTAANAAEEFANSLHETGFAVLYNHPVAKQDIEDLYQRWQQFFEQDSAEKQKFIYQADTQFGWVPPSVAEVAKGATVKDVKEFFNYYEVGICPDTLKPITQKLYNELRSVGYTLLNWLQQEAPDNVKANFSEPLTEMIKESDYSQFRINYYPPITGKEKPGALRAADHTDIDLLTVLTAGTESGLQALEKEGDWHDVPCEHGNLVINTGDMLNEASAGYYPSTVHRVLKPAAENSKKVRMSCPMFIHPRLDVKLSEKHTAASYLHERLVEIGLREA